MRLFLRLLLAVFGVGLIISAVRTMSQGADIENDYERVGYIIGCSLILIWGMWLVARLFIGKKKKNDDGSK